MERSAQKLGSGADYQFIDLEKTGIYNLVVYKERPFEPVCTVFGYMSLNPGLYPEIFPQEWHRLYTDLAARRLVTLRFPTARSIAAGPDASLGKHYAVMAALYDIDHDGAAEIVALTDIVRRGDTSARWRLIRCQAAY